MAVRRFAGAGYAATALSQSLRWAINFRSFADLAALIPAHVARFPRDIDLVVGTSPAGLMAASMVSLAINKPCCDVSALIENRPAPQIDESASSGILMPHRVGAILLVADSVDSGVSLGNTLRQIAGCSLPGRLVTAAVYASERGCSKVDLYLERLDVPRAFAWSLFHRDEVSHYCVDIDGVLCLDPTEDDNDDGPRYLSFLQTATPNARPSRRIGHLVTSRLEKYREPTTRWLDEHGIQFDQLHMLDVATAEERRRRGLHAQFKAQTYCSIESAALFIESEPLQAEKIARLSCRPVLDYSRQRLITADIPENHWQLPKSVRRRVLERMRQVFA